MAEIGEPIRRIVLIPNEVPTAQPPVTPAPHKEPVRVPASEPA